MTLVGANTLALAFADLAAAAAAPTIRARLTPKGSPARIRSALPSITDLRACAQHVRFVPSADVGVQSIARRLWATLQAWLRATFGPPVSCKRQVDFAREPLVAPIKPRLALKLANHIFHNACAEPAVRGRRDGRPTRLDPAQVSLRSAVRDHAISM